MVADRFDCRDPADCGLGLRAAAAACAKGDLVVLPTDTVYGVGGDAFNRQATRALLAAKGRGRQMPSPVLVGSLDDLRLLVTDLTAQVKALVAAFWPGGLTVIARHRPTLGWDLGDTNGTVAVRMPDHPVALQVLQRTGPLAVSSANLTGHPSPQTCDQAQQMLGDRVSVYLDGGSTRGNLSSSIVDLTGEVPVLRREGTICAADLRRVLPTLPDPPTVSTGH